MTIRMLRWTGVIAVLAAAAGCTATRTQQSTGEVIDDSVLTSKVKMALVEDPVTKARQINVETYRGIVQLGGFVDNADQKAQATRVAREVPGVKEVRNDLQISSEDATTGSVIDDSALTASVKSALIDDADTKAYQINVETDHGVVLLTGFVDSSADRDRAGEIARSIEGVSDVRNDLEIRQN
jgi:hyperosmotically inducible protein